MIDRPMTNDLLAINPATCRRRGWFVSAPRVLSLEVHAHACAVYPSGLLPARTRSSSAFWMTAGCQRGRDRAVLNAGRRKRLRRDRPCGRPGISPATASTFHGRQPVASAHGSFARCSAAIITATRNGAVASLSGGHSAGRHRASSRRLRPCSTRGGECAPRLADRGCRASACMADTSLSTNLLGARAGVAAARLSAALEVLWALAAGVARPVGVTVRRFASAWRR